VSWPGITAAGLSSLTVAAYLNLIASQGESDWDVVWCIAALILVGTVAAAVGATVFGGRARMMLLSLAAADHLVLGAIGIFSIGLPLLVAAGFSLAGAVRTAAPGHAGVALAAVGAFLPVAAAATYLVVIVT
jgi:hypothetical protein